MNTVCGAREPGLSAASVVALPRVTIPACLQQSPFGIAEGASEAGLFRVLQHRQDAGDGPPIEVVEQVDGKQKR